MLLAGIKAGKKKKKKKPSSSSTSTIGEPPDGSRSRHDDAPVASSSAKPPPTATATETATATGSLSANNESLAEQLRQSFRQGKAILPPVVKQQQQGSNPCAADSFVSLEDRGRILLQGKLKRDSDDDDDEQNEVIIMGAAISIKKKNDEELTIAEMVAQERIFNCYSNNDSITQNEATAREILRMNKRRKLKKKNFDSDEDEEEEERQLQTIGVVKEKSQKANTGTGAISNNKKPPITARRQERQEQRHEQALQQRAVARHDAQEQIIAKCWWWLEAKLSFQRHRLLALGNFVSLVMTPSVMTLSVVPGRHFYLVPIRHASSLLTCDEQVWLEIRYFQASLRAMYASQKLAVLFTETVLSTSSSFWQTRMECIVVPTDVALDAPLYFKNSMLEQAEEWGTHSHKIYNTSHEKTLVQTLPVKASNLAYFYIDFGNNNNNNSACNNANNATTTTATTGYAQVIESSRFPKDFAADTVAGMMHLDPMRLRRGHKPQSSRGGGRQNRGGGGDNATKNADEEQELIRTFLQEWKAFDWTLQLDDAQPK